MTQCPNCGRAVSEDYPSPDFDTVRLAYCRACGLGFPTRLVTDQELHEYYEVGYRPTRSSTESFLKGQETRADEQYKFITRFKPDSHKTYDIGCGSGALLKRFSGELYGSEWDTALHVPGIAYTEDTPRGTQLVIMSHTLEHLADPVNRLQKIHSNLDAQGVLFIEVPNVPFSEFKSIVEGKPLLGHLFHFTPKSLKQTLEKAGFKVISLSTLGNRVRFPSRNKLVRRIAEKFFTPRVQLRAIATK